MKRRWRRRRKRPRSASSRLIICPTLLLWLRIVARPFRTSVVRSDQVPACPSFRRKAIDLCWYLVRVSNPCIAAIGQPTTSNTIYCYGAVHVAVFPRGVLTGSRRNQPEVMRRSSSTTTTSSHEWWKDSGRAHYVAIDETLQIEYRSLSIETEHTHFRPRAISKTRSQDQSYD